MPEPDPPDIPTRPDDAPRRRDWGDADRSDADDRRRRDNDDRPRRRRRRRSEYYDQPHRGGLILGLGAASVVLGQFCPFIGLGLGAAAWVMGGGDLAAMDAGEMDPAGRSNTRAGRLCGMIGALLNVLYALILVMYVAVLIAVGK